MSKATVTLGASIPLHTVNREKVERMARSVAETFVVPSGIEFASFEEGGRVYALSVRLSVEVDLLPGRVPGVVVREGQLSLPKRTKRRFEVEKR